LKSGVCWSQGVLKALLERGRRFALGWGLGLAYVPHSGGVYWGYYLPVEVGAFNKHVNGGVRFLV